MPANGGSISLNFRTYPLALKGMANDIHNAEKKQVGGSLLDVVATSH